MAGRQSTFIALLRGINVGGRNRIPMAALRSLCSEIGCSDVRTYIQSGNLLFRSALSAKALEERLEQAIEQTFRLSIPVVVRSASTWSGYVNGNPFPDEAAEEGNHVLLGLAKLPPKADAVAELRRRATQAERVVQNGDAIWIHFSGGIGGSKLTPALLDRLAGSSVTTRNWRTVLKLDEMARTARPE